MRNIGTITLLLIASLIFLSSCEDPVAGLEISVIDPQNRAVPNARVELFAQPGNIILEDQDFTDEFGMTFHEFNFTSTLTINIEVENYHGKRLIGDDVVTLVMDDKQSMTIQLHEPVIVIEEED